MAESTNIAWTDSTFNPWLGCSKVGPGCDHCYAEALDRRTGGDHWGATKTPRTMSADNWRKPVRWQRIAEGTGTRRRVFCGSMCDWADKNALDSERARLWALIRSTPMLDWQLLTKRAPNIARCLPADWSAGYENVWLGVTVENRKHGLPRIDHLRRAPARVRFLSIEPLLEDLGEIDLTGIHWVIVGGESGHGARPLEAAWVESIRRQCEAAGVAFFFKQIMVDKKMAHLPYLNGRQWMEFPKWQPEKEGRNNSALMCPNFLMEGESMETISAERATQDGMIGV